MLGTEVKCPNCFYKGYITTNWYPDNGFDPLMVKVRCRACKLEFFVAPPPWYKTQEEGASEACNIAGGGEK